MLSGLNRVSVSLGALFRRFLDRLKSKKELPMKKEVVPLKKYVPKKEAPVEKKPTMEENVKKDEGGYRKDRYTKNKYLKQDPVSKKNREDVYDMLKEEHDIDVEGEDE